MFSGDFQTRYNTLLDELEESARIVLSDINKEKDFRTHEFERAQWEFKNNLNEKQTQKMIEESVKFSDWNDKNRQYVESWKELWSEIPDPKIQRQAELVARPEGVGLPNPDERAKVNHNYIYSNN